MVGPPEGLYVVRLILVQRNEAVLWDNTAAAGVVAKKIGALRSQFVTLNRARFVAV